MMGGRSLGLTLLFTLLSSHAHGLIVEDTFFHQKQGQINQVQYGNVNACGPFSILYALKYGNPFLQTRYQSLPGNTDSEKMDHLIWVARNSSSAISSRKSVFSDDDGMFDYDVAPLIDRLGDLPPSGYERVQPYRQASEKNGGIFSQRVYKAIQHSLSMGYPVIAGVQGRQYDPRKKKWERTWAHTIAIFGLQKVLKKGEIQFAISYYEPWTGEYQYGFLFEETRQSFDHNRRELIDGVSTIIPLGSSGKINVEDENRVSSPFLLLQSPSLYAGYSINFDKREIIVLDNLTLLTNYQNM